MGLGIFSATQLVLKVHKEAVDSLSGSGSSTLGSVAAANETALECSKEIQAAMQVSLRNALNISAMKPIDGPLDDLTIMKVAYSISTTAHVYFIERHLHVTGDSCVLKMKSYRVWREHFVLVNQRQRR